MPENLIIKEGEENAEHLSEGEREAERDLGKVENEVEHHGEQLEEHANKIADVEGMQKWTHDLITSTKAELVEMVIQAKQEAAENHRQLMEAMDSLRTKETSSNQSEETTKPPPETKNEAKKKNNVRDVFKNLF